MITEKVVRFHTMVSVAQVQYSQSVASTVTWAKPREIVWNRMFYRFGTRRRSAL